jgi:CDP-glycerol glycerophosphotransferase (TagB/SpsB family)
LGNTNGDTRVIDYLTPVVKLGRKFFSYNSLTRFVFWLYKFSKKSFIYDELFHIYKPDLVIVTRVVNFSLDYPLLRTAAAFRVPTIGLVSSWDNLTSKGFFPFELQSLVVWNEIMKEEAINLFNFPEKKIFISGIPRYDFLFNLDEFSTYKEFCTKLGLNSSKKIILYGTGSSTTGITPLDLISPEPGIALFVAEKINDGTLGHDLQLLVRLHPQAKIDDYKSLLDLPNVFVHMPGQKTKFRDRLFSIDDDIIFAETLKYSSVLINLCSTLSIDAAVFDVTIICINFNHHGERPFKYSVSRMYEFDHYAKLLKTNGVRLANDHNDLINAIKESLSYPELRKSGRRQILEQHCYYTDGCSGLRTANYIIDSLNTDSIIKSCS